MQLKGLNQFRSVVFESQLISISITFFFFFLITYLFIYLFIYTYTLHPDTAMNRRVGKIAITDIPDTIITTKANLIKTADIYIHALG